MGGRTLSQLTKQSLKAGNDRCWNFGMIKNERTFKINLMVVVTIRVIVFVVNVDRPEFWSGWIWRYITNNYRFVETLK